MTLSRDHNDIMTAISPTRQQPVGPRRPNAEVRVEIGRSGRELCLYPGFLGYDLQQELEFLTNRVMEPNIFFSPRLLAPAMPRIEDKQVRIALIRDELEDHSRMRLLMPFTIEKPGFSIGPPIMRTWANPFGPLGTPLVDAEDAAETIDNLLESLSKQEAGLPSVLVLPQIRLEGRFSQLARAISVSRELPVVVTGQFERPMLESTLEGDAYFRNTISRHHLGEVRRQWRKLSAQGLLEHNVARQPEDVRIRMEEFLALEARGWKGRQRTALVNDRFHAAFAREAITNLAEIDAVRVHTIDLNGKAIASLIVFVIAGEAYTWKTTYDENYARQSPGKLLMIKLTEWHLDDANILRTDSCAVPDHPMIAGLWSEREAMGTLLIGLTPNSDRDVRQAATQLHLYNSTRNIARILRQKIMSIAGRPSG